jgi:hypothetical protein
METCSRRWKMNSKKEYIKIAPWSESQEGWDDADFICDGNNDEDEVLQVMKLASEQHIPVLFVGGLYNFGNLKNLNVSGGC